MMKRRLIFAIALMLFAGLTTVSAQSLEAANELLERADAAIKRYDVDGARDLLDRYRAMFGKGKRRINQPIPAEADELEATIELTEQMLARVERIEVVDSILVDADTFFRAYALSPSCGSILAPNDVPKGMKGIEESTVYRSEDGRLMIWAADSGKDSTELVSSSQLTDGTWEKPHPLGDDLNEGGDVAYPFLMPDGITLYYAQDGDNSLGGYDIFITRNDGERFLQPQNIGMPYNSPYDDYLLAIDESTGFGWWATDRNQIEGKVTVYVFRTADSRENYPSDTPGLAELALLTSISDTWPGGEAPKLRRPVIAANDAKGAAKPEFTLALPGARVVHTMAELRSLSARAAMEQLLHVESEAAGTQSALAKLRAQWASGNHSQRDKILALERRLLSQQREAARLKNEVVRLETSH